MTCKAAVLLRRRARRTTLNQPHPQRDENVAVVRAANLLAHYTGDAAYAQIARHAMRYLAAPSIAGQLPASTVLLPDLELGSAPLHLTIVGPKGNQAARDLFHAALAYPSSYKRLEWWDPREGRLPNPDVQYPELKLPAAFVCTNRTCSSPIYKAEDLKMRVDKLLGLTARTADSTLIQSPR